MPYERYSHTFKKRRWQEKLKEYQWFVGYDWILFFFAAIFSGLMITTMYTDIDPELVDIAVYQLIMGVIGLLMGLVINAKRLRVSMPTQKDAEKMFTYVLSAFILLQIINNGILMADLSAFGTFQITPDMNIALTAAVMEEALYSFAFTTFFYTIFLYMIVRLLQKQSEEIKLAAQIIASAMVGLFFVFIHVGIYGVDPTIVAMLFINRAVYAFVYIRTRNLMVPTALHLMHNMLVLLAF